MDESVISFYKKLNPPPTHLPCPRCNSHETKFMYYNNYNLQQPRYNCKGCDRKWTAGGTLRDVPVGGGKRKSATTSSSSKRRLHDTTASASSGIVADNVITGQETLLPAQTDDPVSGLSGFNNILTVEPVTNPFMGMDSIFSPVNYIYELGSDFEFPAVYDDTLQLDDSFWTY